MTRAISINQPHVEHILSGQKKREFRSWNTNIRGTVLIHCSQNVDKGAMQGMDENDFVRGAICGKVDIVGVEKYGEKDFGWILENPQRLKPVPKKGSLGFFNV